MTTTFLEKSPEDLGNRGASFFETAIHDILTKQKTVVCALCGGRAIKTMLSALVTKDISWRDVRIFLTDERLVPLDSADSNFKQLNEYLFDKLVKNASLPKENIHPFIVKDFLPDFGVSLYQQEFEAQGNNLDIIVVSAGEDGHIASLFPNHASVQNTESKYGIVENAPKPPARRMSLSPLQIQKAQFSIILFSGSAKKAAFTKFLNDTSSAVQCPAVLVKQTGKTVVIADIQR